MLTRIFGQINSSTTIFIGLFALALSIGHFLAVPVPDFTLTTAWGRLVFLPLAGYFIYGLSLVILVFGMQWLLEYNYKLLKKHAYFSFFILIVLLFFVKYSGLNLLIDMLFLLLILGSWLSVYQGEMLLGRTLNTGLLIGLASIFDQRISLLLLFSILVYIIFGRFSLRTMLILIVGYTTIWLNALALEYILFDSSTVYNSFIAVFDFTTPALQADLDLFDLILLSSMLLFALPEFGKTINRASVFKRQSNTVLLLMVALAIVLYVINGPEVFYLALYIPASLTLFVNYFQYIKRTWVQELILWLAIAILLLADFGVV